MRLYKISQADKINITERDNK